MTARLLLKKGHEVVFIECEKERVDALADILASLMGRSLGFRRVVVTKIEDPELEHLCIEVGLDNTLIPDRAIGRYV